MEMKTLHLSIIVMAVGILIASSLQNVSATPYMSPQDLYKQSSMAFYGQVISKQTGPGPDYYYYQVKVSTFFKNPQTSDSITVAGHKPSEGHMAYPQFEVGDKVVFYIVKQDGILVASPWSIKAGEGCDIHAFLGPAPIPGEPIVRGMSIPLEQVTDANITTRSPFKVNQALLVSYHVWNNFPQSRNVTVQLSAINQNDTTSSYYKNQTVAVGACDASTINWIFAPTKVGYYIVDANEIGKFRAGEDFEVVDSKSDVSINSKFVGSPLMQLKSGISAQDVKCKSNLQLVIKAEDGSPSCVSPQTGTKLIQMGWAVQAINSLKQWVEIGTLGLNDAYNVGQPIAFSVTIRGFGHYPCVAPQVEIHDNKNPDMSIFHDNGGTMSCPVLIAPDNYSFDFPGKNDHYVTSINKTGYYTLTISYGSNSIQKYFSVIPKATLENDTGIVTLGNKTYYFETPNYTETAYVHPVQISFHDVIFTLFPSGFRGGLPTCCGVLSNGCSGSYYWTDAKFSDGIHELLHIFAYSQPCPVHSIPTHFSTHANPQAGLTFYDVKMKLLVSTDNKSSSVLRLYLSTDSTYANPAEAVGVDILLNNTSSTPLILTKADNWPRNDLSSGPCSNLPFGMAILKGYYTEQNMTGASSLVIYQNIPCPLPPSIKSYTFQPLSSEATQECDSVYSCPELSDMKIHLKIDGFMDNNGQHRPFNVGTYTIVGGDEWGHLVIQHFTEAYATAYAGVK